MYIILYCYVKSVWFNARSTKRTAEIHKWINCKVTYSFSKYGVPQPERANVSCNSHDLHFAIRCDLQRCKEPRDPLLNQQNLFN